MNNGEEIKEIVREKYAQIVIDSEKEVKSSCCGGEKTKTAALCCGSSSETDVSDDYSALKGYNADADLKLGCGLPTAYAGIKEGDTVVDLGSGAGNDVFVARALVGETGKVIGLDMTPEMIDKAERNNRKLGYSNVEFVLGEIEAMPLPSDMADVIVSNCVLNLVPDKDKAFREMYRVLKKGAHFCVSDIVTSGDLPEETRRSASLYAGCVSGALKEEDYINGIKAAGFRDVAIQKRKSVPLPQELLAEFLDEDEIEEVKKNKLGLFSITVTGTK